MTDLHIAGGKLLVRRDALIHNGVYSHSSYRKQKSVGRFDEVLLNDDKWVVFDSIPEVTRYKITRIFAAISREHLRILEVTKSVGGDIVRAAVDVTSQSLNINEPFMRSALDTYMNTHYMLYTGTYLDQRIPANSVKGYARQCAMVQWMYDFVKNIRDNEAGEKQCEVLLRSFRMNLLTAIRSMVFEVKIPLSEARFNAWFDDILRKMDKGYKPSEVISPKRLRNSNAGKITPEQIDIAQSWYINGLNMPVRMVYRKWKEYGKKAGWWMINGRFTPPTEARLYQILKPLKNPSKLEKTDAITFRLSSIPSVSRDLPEKKNHVWVIDGTAHNENVKYNGKVRQHVYAIKVMDVATMRIVGVSGVIGVKEPFYALKDAILMAIRTTGSKPAMIQTDHGPAWRELEIWCKENDIKLYASFVGNARAKTIESMFNMFDNDITRSLPGYSGQNRTAQALNSRSSEKRETEGKRSAKSIKIAMHWLKTEGVRLWNERVIETLEGQRCDKTPMELWDEKESFTPEMSYRDLCIMCGTLHERKLTINGLDIEHKGHSYTYFPPIDTPEQRELAEAVFTSTPLDARTANKFRIYILDGGEPAAVFSRENVYLGVWKIKERVAFIADSDDENSALGKMLALQKRVENKAKEINEGVKKRVAMHPDFDNIERMGKEALTGKHRAYTGRYDKSELLAEEADFKAGALNIPETKFRELVDPDTGEIIMVRIAN